MFSLQCEFFVGLPFSQIVNQSIPKERCLFTMVTSEMSVHACAAQWHRFYERYNFCTVQNKNVHSAKYKNEVTYYEQKSFSRQFTYTYSAPTETPLSHRNHC